ncbi:MAG: Txe/YoeB family addiction module toxin [Dehalococcoidia bacterium]
MSTNPSGEEPSGGGWKIVFTRQAAKDGKLLTRAGLRPKAEALLSQLRADPFEPPYEKLVANLAGAYSRRINLQHRLVYEVFVEVRTVKVLRMWTHYD